MSRYFSQCFVLLQKTFNRGKHSCILQQQQHSKCKKMAKSLAKCHLHCHMDGAIRMTTAFELAKAAGDLEKWNVSTIEQYAKLIRPPRSDLATFLNGFQYFIQYFQGNLTNIERMAREFLEDVIQDNTVYIEARYAPLLLLSDKAPDVKPKDIIAAVNKGFNSVLTAQKDKHRIVVKQIFCCLTFQSRANFFETLDLVKEFKDKGLGDHNAVGIDIAGAAGDDYKFNQDVIDVFEAAAKEGIHRTAHAGENSGADCVRQALELLKAQRIGHGYHALNDDSVYKQMLTKRINFEICPVSSWLTASVPEDYKKHPLVRLIADDANYSLSSDDPLIVDGWLEQDYATCLDKIGVSREALIKANRNAIDSAFCSEEEKNLVRGWLDEMNK